jgi:hypothetical protein
VGARAFFLTEDGHGKDPPGPGKNLEKGGIGAGEAFVVPRAGPEEVPGLEAAFRNPALTSVVCRMGEGPGRHGAARAMPPRAVRVAFLLGRRNEMKLMSSKTMGALALAGLLTAPLAGCETNDGYGMMGRPGWGKTETGAVLGGATGAAAGAAIGSQSDNTGKGALIGGATGAVLGGVIGRQLEKNDIRDDYQDRYRGRYDGRYDGRYRGYPY